MQTIKVRKTWLCAALLATTLVHSQAQTATWTAGGGNSDWNNGLNWDQLLAPDVGTNAVITGGATVDYNTPMVAANFAGVNNSGILNIATNGFNIDALGLAAYTGNAGSMLRVSSNGVFSATNSGSITLSTGSEISVEGGVLSITNSTGNISFGLNANNNGAGFTNNGGTVVFSQPFQSRGRFSRFVMNGGTLNFLGGGGIFESSNDQERQFLINGGTAFLGDFSIGRTLNTVGTAGLVISNGIVTASSLRIGTGIAAAGATIFGGVLTNTGAFTISDRNNAATSGQRRVFLYVRGGSVYSTDAAGIILGNQSNSGAAAASVMGGFLDMTAGLLVAQGITLVKDTTLTNTHGTLTLSGTGQIYLGSVGLIGNNGVSGTTYTVALNGGTLGAIADYAINANTAIANTMTIQAADAGGVAHNITHNGNLSGAGALVKTGLGTLTLNGANTYSGNTTVSVGSLALGAAASIANTPQITIASGATFDVSALGSYSLNSARTLAGAGTVAGAVVAQSGATISPGVGAGTLSFLSNLTLAGGVVNNLELSTGTSDLIAVAGTLDVSAGNNTILIAAIGGSLPAGTYPLFSYGSFIGSTANFTVSGAPGVLTNNTSTKTISLITSGVRAPANVTWVGNAVANNWNVLISTNWLNGVALDYFVQGDTALFNATGTANPIVNITQIVNPTSVKIDASANYTFTGVGNINGSASLVKTNLGTLTIQTTNTYSGPTTISGGTVEVSVLANGGAASGIGASSSSADNLVIENAGILKYSGATVSVNRGATLNGQGGTLEIVNSAATLTASGSLVSTGALTKAGSGTLALPGPNTYSGGTVINAGTLQVGAAGAGTGPITNNNSMFRLSTTTTLANPVAFGGVCTIDLANQAGNQALDGAWSGSGTVNFINQNVAAVRTFTIGGASGGSMTEFSGTLNVGTNNGFFRFNDGGGSPNTGSSNAIFNLGSSTARLLNRNRGGINYLGSLSGGSGTMVTQGTDNTGTTTFVIGGRNLDSTFAGSLSGASGADLAISKVGSGKLTLSGTNVYGGATIVESGGLQVDGSISTSPVTVMGGVLSGNGILGGSVVVNFGSTLSPGTSVGALTISNSLQLDSGSTNIMELGSGTNDSVQGLTFVSYSGTLVVTNVGATLTAGQTFTLFVAPESSYAGAFEAIVLPSLGAGLSWNTDNLLVNGSISVVGVVPTSISQVVRNGSTLEFSGTGPANETYYVLSSTNLALPLANWTSIETNVFNGVGAFSFTNAIVPGVPRNFYLLQILP